MDPSHKPRSIAAPLVSNKNVNFQTEGSWGSFASWEDKDGTRWVLAPIGGPMAVDFPVSYGPTPNGGVIALKLTDAGGKIELAPAWLSRDMMSAEPPVVANGIVFVLAAGEFTAQANDEDGGLYSYEQRIQHSIPAKLYALDASHWKGALFQWRPDRFLSAPGRYCGSRRQGDFRHVRRHNLLLRSGMKDSMRFLAQPASICFAAACLFSGLAYAQGPPRGFWTAPDANAAHTNAQKAETQISTDTVTKDFKFLWKLKLGSGPTKSNSFTEPLLYPGLITGRGFKDMALVADQNTVYSVDSELGELVWKKDFPASHSACANIQIVTEAPPVIHFGARPVAKPGQPPPPRPPEQPPASS